MLSNLNPKFRFGLLRQKRIKWSNQNRSEIAKILFFHLKPYQYFFQLFEIFTRSRFRRRSQSSNLSGSADTCAVKPSSEVWIIFKIFILPIICSRQYSKKIRHYLPTMFILVNIAALCCLFWLCKETEFFKQKNSSLSFSTPSYNQELILTQ